ncbi:hypothetical protein CPC08DRAFT_806138 [Agrocybe pediades]|nr:hypothetical protein CPC08DRAFT_806138 [Agrocybe pediades]
MAPSAFFPPSLALPNVLNVIAAISSTFPLLSLHNNQKRVPRQPTRTKWWKTARDILASAFQAEDLPELQFLVPPETRGNETPENWLSEILLSNMDHIHEYLDINEQNYGRLFPKETPVLVSIHQNCQLCPLDEAKRLRCKDKPQQVRVLGKDRKWLLGYVFVSHCKDCLADYWPDRYTFLDGTTRKQKLEINASYLRISKTGVWVHRSIAWAQEHAIFRFHCGWSNFAHYINDLLGDGSPKITLRQVQRMFLEHASRRLLVAHNKVDEFVCSNSPSSLDFAKQMGGHFDSSIHHRCMECTHKKRYRADLVQEGAQFEDGNNPPIPPDNPPPGAEQRGYVRMAVMDGKTMGHRICALNDCENPLANYKDGRFCAAHSGLNQICGIMPCGRPIASPTSVTCDLPAHVEWHRKYLQRFGRLNYPGVRRVIRRQQEDGALPGLRVNQQLPALGEIPGEEVVHTFRARSVYCLQTVQWACGIPIGWGKCFKSESLPQVLQVLDRVFEGGDENLPGFCSYDNACGLYRHIITQDPDSRWIKMTRFIVDSWHYIGHRATDTLCRLWCNPAPTNGQQPDLVLTVTDNNGQQHSARAFNLETAEQLNSWLDGYESQLIQMSDVNYDVYVHYLMLLFKEDIERRIEERNQALDEEFWN